MLRAVTWAASTSKKRNIELPCLVIWPSRRRFPLESSRGTNPRYHAMPMPQQLPQIPILPIRYPDLGKTIFHQQLQNMLRILPIRFLLAYPLGANLAGVANPQFEGQLRQQTFKPACMPAGFHSHSHLLALGSEVTIKLFCSLTVL